MTTPELLEAPPAARSRSEPLVLADGLELIGEYEDSGFKEPPLLARRADGQVIKLRRLPYLIAAASDGRRDADGVAAVVSEQYGRTITGGDVQYLVERTLRPLGILALADGTTPKLPKRAPVMALRHRRPLVPERAVNLIARGFSWLHRPAVQALVLLSLAVFDFWLFGIHGIAGGMRAVLYNPVLLLGVLASVVVATAFHEIGHASACRYGGARPGVIGVGIYLVWPAFYCDVTDAYRLNRAGRLRTDLGGVYFNGIFALLAGAAAIATGEEALLLVAFVQHTIMLQQLLPLLRFDGYYVLSDLTGVPDILSRIKPIFRSLVPGRGREPGVDELKPWVRVVVTLYLAVLVPALTFMVVSTVLAAPRIFATAYDSLGLQVDRMRAAPGAAELGLGTVRIGSLVFPLAAIAVSVMRTGRMAARGLFAWSSGNVARRAFALAAIGAVAGAAGYTWWPNGDYQPIRPGERGTVGDALSTIGAFPGGRPGFTKDRAGRFQGVPTAREEEAKRTAPGADPHAPPDRRGAPERHDGDRPGDDASDGGDGLTGDPAASDEPRADPPAPDDPPADPTASPEPGAPAPAAPSGTPEPSPSAGPTPSVTATPTATATSSPSPTATDTPTATPTPSPTAAASPTSTSDVAATPTPDQPSPTPSS